MNHIVVKDLMVPLEGYATVSRTATLHDAVMALEKSMTRVDPAKHKHRAVLVLDNGGDVVGKLTMFDILIALEPQYAGLDISEATSRSGLNEEFIKSMLNRVFWDKPFQFFCGRAAELNVSDFMQSLDDGFFIKEEATLGEAIHRLVIPRYQSLLVTRDGKVVGVLRLSDVFSKVCTMIAACEV